MGVGRGATAIRCDVVAPAGEVVTGEPASDRARCGQDAVQLLLADSIEICHSTLSGVPLPGDRP